MTASIWAADAFGPSWATSPLDGGGGGVGVRVGVGAGFGVGSAGFGVGSAGGSCPGIAVGSGVGAAVAAAAGGGTGVGVTVGESASVGAAVWVEPRRRGNDRGLSVGVGRTRGARDLELDAGKRRACGGERARGRPLHPSSDDGMRSRSRCRHLERRSGRCRGTSTRSACRCSRRPTST